MREKVRSLILDILGVTCLPDIQTELLKIKESGSLGLKERSRLEIQIGDPPAYQ